MEVKIMFYERLKTICLRNGITVSSLVKALGLSTSKVTAWKNGSVPKGENLVKIADYFDCSVDYLLGRQTGNHFNIKNTGDNVGVVGQANAPVTIHNANEKQLSKQEYELLKIFDSLDVVKQAKLLVFAAELEKGG